MLTLKFNDSALTALNTTNKLKPYKSTKNTVLPVASISDWTKEK